MYQRACRLTLLGLGRKSNFELRFGGALSALLIAGLARADAPPGSQSAPPQAPAPNAPVSAEAEEGDDDSAEGTQGTIVQIERGVVFFDLGAEEDLVPGARLRVLRTIIARHPITGKQLRDHFPLGGLTVEQVSKRLSMGRLDPRIVGAVKVGDVIRIPPAASARSAAASRSLATAAAIRGSGAAVPAPVAPGAGAKPAPQDAATQALIGIFEMTLGRAPSERVQLLGNYLAGYPSSPYAEALRTEIASFQRIDAALRTASALMAQASESAAESARAAAGLAAEQRKNLLRLEILAQLPRRLDAADSVDLAITVRDPSAVRAAFAYVRRPEAHTYERFVLTPDGDGYFRGRIPLAIVAPPSFELFLEAWSESDERVTAGTPLNPVSVQVDPRPGRPPSGPRGRSEFRGFFEYVDFNRFKGNDYYLVSEGDFTFRPGTWLAGVSGGFGVLYGRGGKNDVLQGLQDPSLCRDALDRPVDPACGQRAGFNYGYFELEFRFGRYVGLAPRLMVGQTVAGPGAGGELKLRIGQATSTNLQLGVSYFKDFGALGSLHLEWTVVRGLPMGASVIVTNQPAQGDVGVRIVYQIAYRARPWLQPALRLGVAARNIEQIGLSVGLGLITAW